jgi:hypothetical protein
MRVLHSYSEKSFSKLRNVGLNYLLPFFCKVAHALNEPAYSHYARRVLDWTCSTHSFDQVETPAGLYFGHGSIPVVQAMITDGLHDTSSQEQGLRLANRITTASPVQTDITHGAAGIGVRQS